MATYTDITKCPEGHRIRVERREQSAGQKVCTYCAPCDKRYDLVAGPLPARAPKVRQFPTLERQIETRLVKRVTELGGEVRKVAWIGRKGAPDRLVMLPEVSAEQVEQWLKRPLDEALTARPSTTIWVELKAPGKAAKFPTTAHEKAQHREHERMRKMGQHVVVIDSYEQIEELLK